MEDARKRKLVRRLLVLADWFDSEEPRRRDMIRLELG
jgi:hypothetical protein